MMNTSASILLSLLIGGSSLAASLPPDCAQVEELNKKVRSCAANRKYGEAAKGCLARFTGKLRGDGERALRSLQAALDLKPASALGEAAALRSLESAKGAISEVIALGERTESQVDEYLNNLLYPEDWDAPVSVRGETHKFFDSHPCYARVRDALETQVEKVQESLSLYRSSLRKAEARLASLRAAGPAH